MLKIWFGVGLAQAKMHTHEACARLELTPVYEAACKARDPNYPYGRSDKGKSEKDRS